MRPFIDRENLLWLYNKAKIIVDKDSFELLDEAKKGEYAISIEEKVRYEGDEYVVNNNKVIKAIGISFRTLYFYISLKRLNIGIYTKQPEDSFYKTLFKVYTSRIVGNKKSEKIEIQHRPNCSPKNVHFYGIDLGPYNSPNSSIDDMLGIVINPIFKLYRDLIDRTSYEKNF